MNGEGERTGRRAGTEGRNRALILAAARAEFSAKGFHGSTLRRIAARAGFDVALLAHYFGNKDGLFAATLELPERSDDMLIDALSGPQETQGNRLTRAYLGLWEDSASSQQMQALARSALNNEAALTHIQALLTGATAGPELGALLTGRRTGFSLAMAHLVGVAFARYLTHLPSLAQLDFETLIARTAPAIQLHLATTDD